MVDLDVQGFFDVFVGKCIVLAAQLEKLVLVVLEGGCLDADVSHVEEGWEVGLATLVGKNEVPVL